MSCVLYLLGSNQLDFTTLFNYELAPVPTSLFEDSGKACYLTTISVLMNKLKDEVSSQGIVPDDVVVDGRVMLYSAIYWPKDGLVDSAIRHGHTRIKVISADTDVSVILCYHYLQSDWSQAEVYLEDFQAGKGIISITETVEKNKSIVPSLTALHAISGCDSVPRMFGIGKAKALSVTRKKPLMFIGKLEASKEDVIQEAKFWVLRVTNLNGLPHSLLSYGHLIPGERACTGRTCLIKKFFQGPSKGRYIPWAVPEDRGYWLNGVLRLNV